MKNAVVSGATGFLGKALSRELLSENIKVYGLGRNKNKLDEVSDSGLFVPVQISFEDYIYKISEFVKEPVDVFYHFAWEGGFTDAIKDYHLQMKNAAYAGDAVIAAQKLNCKKFVYAGTYNEFELKTLLNQKCPKPRNTCIYSTGKLAGDMISRTLANNIGMNYCSGLVPMPYGEENYSKQLVNIVILSLLQGVPPKLVEGQNMYDLVYIKDIARAFVKIGKSGINGKGYYIGHRKLKTFREWMIELRDSIAPDVELRFGEYKDNQTIDYSLIDLDELYEDTKFECEADFKKTMRLSANWVKENLLIKNTI